MARTVTGMDLAELIERTKGDRSYAELEAATGGAVSRQRWQQMGVQRTSAALPAPATLRAIASALGVSERLVVLAAARTAGLSVEEDGGPLWQLLPPTATRLTDTQVSAVLTIIRALLEASHATPMTPDIDDPLIAGLDGDLAATEPPPGVVRPLRPSQTTTARDGRKKPPRP